MFIRHSITPLLQITLKAHIHNYTIVTLLSKNIRMIFAYFFFYETQILNHCNCNKKWHMTRDRGYPMAQYNRLKKSTKITGNLLLETLLRKNLFLFIYLIWQENFQSRLLILLCLNWDIELMTEPT